MKIEDLKITERERFIRWFIASLESEELMKTMIDPNTPPSVKVRAAEAIFNHAFNIELEDVVARLENLKRAMEISKPEDKDI